MLNPDGRRSTSKSPNITPSPNETTGMHAAAGSSESAKTGTTLKIEQGADTPTEQQGDEAGLKRKAEEQNGIDDEAETKRVKVEMQGNTDQNGMAENASAPSAPEESSQAVEHDQGMGSEEVVESAVPAVVEPLSTTDGVVAGQMPTSAEPSASDSASMQVPLVDTTPRNEQPQSDVAAISNGPASTIAICPPHPADEGQSTSVPSVEADLASREGQQQSHNDLQYPGLTIDPTNAASSASAVLAAQSVVPPATWDLDEEDKELYGP